MPLGITRMSVKARAVDGISENHVGMNGGAATSEVPLGFAYACISCSEPNVDEGVLQVEEQEPAP